MSQTSPPNLDSETKGLSVDDLDRHIQELDVFLQPFLDRLSALKKRRRAKVAARASGKARAGKVTPAEVLAAFDEYGGGRGHIPLLMKKFELSDSSIHRKLKQARTPAGNHRRGNWKG